LGVQIEKIEMGGHVERLWERRPNTEFCWRNLRGTNQLEDLGVGE